MSTGPPLHVIAVMFGCLRSCLSRERRHLNCPSKAAFPKIPHLIGEFVVFTLNIMSYVMVAWLCFRTTSWRVFKRQLNLSKEADDQ